MDKGEDFISIERLIAQISISHPEPNELTSRVCQSFIKDFGESEFRRAANLHKEKGVSIYFIINVYRAVNK